MTKMSPSKRRGRPPKAKSENMSPWLNELSDLNQEVNALRRQLVQANTIIKYLEFQLGLKPYEDSSI